jgi:diguanylate cyclase (GGDEF)-like protein
MSMADWLRLGYVLLLVAGLGHSAYRYASKHHTHLDELSLLVFLICGVNLVVQTTGGLSSHWQGLYLVLGGLASVAFSRRHVVLLVLLVLFLSTSNYLLHPSAEEGALDLLRLGILFLVAVAGFRYMERAERERAERAEDRLLRLNASLRQLSSGDDGGKLDADGEAGATDHELSALSDEGQLAGATHHVDRLEEHLRPLLELALKSTDARGAELLQVADDEERYFVWLTTRETRPIAQRPFSLRGTFLAEAVRDDRPVTVESSRPPWKLGPRSLPQSTMESFLAVPFRRWDEPPCLLVLHHEAPTHFHDARRDVAVGIAEQMAEVLLRFRREARYAAEERELKGLLRASEKLSSTARLAELLRHVADYARDITEFDSCAICLVSEGEDHFEVALTDGYRSDSAKKLYPLSSPTWAGYVLRARDEPLALRIEKRSSMPILDPKERPTSGTSFLAVPFRAHQRVSGALLLTRKGASFSAREFRLLRIYSNQASVAIENAIVYERVENLAATDALTGLFNRRYLEEALAREFSRADRFSSGFALLVLDIDHFKGFNDTYGHTMGDVVLKRVAETLQAGLRKADVLVRFGGEEFIALLPQVGARGAKDSAERLRTSVERAGLHPAGRGHSVTVSVGYALFPDDAKDKDELLRVADRALYDAKQSGRNRVCRYRHPEAK